MGPNAGLAGGVANALASVAGKGLGYAGAQATLGGAGASAIGSMSDADLGGQIMNAFGIV